MFQICILNQKVQGKKTYDILDFLLHAMIRGFKIKNILKISLKIKILYNLINVIRKFVMKNSI
jgi:hypothetical protein